MKTTNAEIAKKIIRAYQDKEPIEKIFEMMSEFDDSIITGDDAIESLYNLLYVKKEMTKDEILFELSNSDVDTSVIDIEDAESFRLVTIEMIKWLLEDDRILDLRYKALKTEYMRIILQETIDANQPDGLTDEQKYFVNQDTEQYIDNLYGKDKHRAIGFLTLRLRVRCDV